MLFRSLANNDVLVAGDGSATREAVASGERDVAPVSEYDAFELKAKGEPVDVTWLQDGTIMVPAPLALVKGSPDNANGMALAKYLLSQEGQELVVKNTLSWSARKDVPAPPGKPDMDSIKTVTFDWTKAATEKSQLLNLYFQDFESR